MGSLPNPLMSGSGNPAQAAMARKIIESLQSRGVSPQQPGPSGMAPEAAQDSLSQQLSELRGIDPGLLLRKFSAMKQDVVQTLPTVAFQVPAATKHLGKILEGLNGFLKEIEQARNVEGAASQGGNIGHTAAMSEQPSGEPNSPPAMGMGAIGS